MSLSLRSAAASDFKTAESDWHAVCGAPSATAEGNGEFSAASDFKRADFLTGVTLGARYEVSTSKSKANDNTEREGITRRQRQLQH